MATSPASALFNAVIAGTGLLPVEAERQGKTVITTEMGGSENVTAGVHYATQAGLRNVLVQQGVLRGEVAPRPRPARWAVPPARPPTAR